MQHAVLHIISKSLFPLPLRDPLRAPQGCTPGVWPQVG
jgi:hypothetical protein